MATKSRSTGFPEFFADTGSAENLRRQLIEAPMEAAGPLALGIAVDLAPLMRIIPDAFAASQRRELQRIRNAAGENDPRAVALQTSIEQVDAFRTMVRRAEARVQ